MSEPDVVVEYYKNAHADKQVNPSSVYLPLITWHLAWGKELTFPDTQVAERRVHLHIMFWLQEYNEHEMWTVGNDYWLGTKQPADRHISFVAELVIVNCISTNTDFAENDKKNVLENELSHKFGIIFWLWMFEKVAPYVAVLKPNGKAVTEYMQTRGSLRQTAKCFQQ